MLIMLSPSMTDKNIKGCTFSGMKAIYWHGLPVILLEGGIGHPSKKMPAPSQRGAGISESPIFFG
jgi:hypothetical protein